MSFEDNNAIEDNITLSNAADYEVVQWPVDENDVPEDISGDTYRAEVREYKDGPLLASFTFEIFLDNTEPTPFYKYRRTMSLEIVEAIGKTEARWDQFREHADGFVEKDFYGSVSIPDNITDPTVTP